MKRYPRTFLQLVTWGHVFVSLPLLVAAGYVLIGLSTLNERYRATMELVSMQARLGSELAEDLLHMEKSIRRHEVLKDAESLNDYLLARREWKEVLAEFAENSSLPAAMISELRAQADLEEAAYQALRQGATSAQLLAVIDEIRPRANWVLDQASQFLDGEKARFFNELDALRSRLVLAAVVAASLTFIFLWLIRRLLASLIARFERAVLRLGKGDLQQPIALDGPGDLRWLGRWLEWLRRRLLSLEESRAQVLRHVSHELKTPLAAMNEGASLLAEEVAGPLTTEQGRIVNIMQSNVHRLRDLIEGLLRLQQAGHVAERIGYESLRFDQVVLQIMDTCELIAAERNIAFDCVLPAVEIVAGPEALQTIIHNLISNAMKFSPDHGRISVVLSRDDENACLDVIDQGPGVKPEEAKEIFEPFYRSPAAKSVAGIGLGLAISREFVLAHRGKLELVPSSLGAHFRVELPLRASYLREQQKNA